MTKNCFSACSGAAVRENELFWTTEQSGKNFVELIEAALLFPEALPLRNSTSSTIDDRRRSIVRPQRSDAKSSKSTVDLIEQTLDRNSWLGTESKRAVAEFLTATERLRSVRRFDDSRQFDAKPSTGS